jgi:predicted ATP-dependent Lon-type protease
MTDWTKLPAEELIKIAEKHYTEAYGQAVDYVRHLSKETLVMMLNNLDNYQHFLNKRFSDEEVS